MRTLTDQVVLVTGASSGIGRATALGAARAGAHVVLVARDPTALHSTAAECETAGAASTLVVPTDVGLDDAVRAMVSTTLERHGRLDVVVSGAGVVSYGRAEAVPAEVFDRVLRTNLLGAANVARHVLPTLRHQRSGTLLYVGSVIGHVAVPSLTAYAVSKWGLRSLVHQLRLENRDLRGVHIGYVAPGGVDTPIYREAANYGGWEARPPPPYVRPERVARQILDRLARPRRRAQLSAANDVVRFGFTCLPVVYDHLVGPMCQLLAVDLSRPAPSTSGNVLHSRDTGHQVSGDHGGVLRGIGSNVSSLLRRAAGHPASADP
ncbi:SDR family NAD(P)-dependent oxidoreductase [Nocardioides sp. URHA0020]|uniref:SDR family NAD(P)-dependent oxidoreductase n=1 Tax=Nocardioides sp. URHA0020 TaxID=1380392 RepID=UPI0018CC6F92|nr:SDR family NAD(P)-dependent oxidoreductase [Nocardioides sp. URHA0020]